MTSLCRKMHWWIHFIGCWCINPTGDRHGKWCLKSIKYSSFSICFIDSWLVVTPVVKPNIAIALHPGMITKRASYICAEFSLNKSSCLKSFNICQSILIRWQWFNVLLMFFSSFQFQPQLYGKYQFFNQCFGSDSRMPVIFLFIFHILGSLRILTNALSMTILQ